jgi:hypothetical protein
MLRPPCTVRTLPPLPRADRRPPRTDGHAHGPVDGAAGHTTPFLILFLHAGWLRAARSLVPTGSCESGSRAATICEWQLAHGGTDGTASARQSCQPSLALRHLPASRSAAPAPTGLHGESTVACTAPRIDGRSSRVDRSPNGPHDSATCVAGRSLSLLRRLRRRLPTRGHNTAALRHGPPAVYASSASSIGIAPEGVLSLALALALSRYQSLAETGLELLHDNEDDGDARHDAAKVGPEPIVKRHHSL